MVVGDSLSANSAKCWKDLGKGISNVELRHETSQHVQFKEELLLYDLFRNNDFTVE